MSAAALCHLQLARLGVGYCGNELCSDVVIFVGHGTAGNRIGNADSSCDNPPAASSDHVALQILFTVPCPKRIAIPEMHPLEDQC